jgi:hypothetical protein
MTTTLRRVSASIADSGAVAVPGAGSADFAIHAHKTASEIALVHLPKDRVKLALDVAISSSTQPWQAFASGRF